MSKSQVSSALVPSAPIPTSPVPSEIGPAGDNIIWNFVKMLCGIAASLCCDLKVYGRRNIPEKGGVLIVANHQGFVDPIALTCLVRRPISYLAKAELFENRFLGWLFRELHGVPVRQGEGDIGALRETIKRLKQGYVLMIFPEGSRTEDGEMMPLQPGIGLIARKAGVPVIPAVVDGSFAALPRGAKWIKCKPVRVQYGPAMNFDGMKATEIVQKIENTLRTMFEDLRTRERSNDIRM